MSDKELLNELANAVIEYIALRDDEENFTDEHGNEFDWDEDTATEHEELVQHMCAKRAKVAALLREALGKEVEFWKATFMKEQTRKDEVNLFENHDEGSGGWAEGTVWVGTTAFRYETKHFDEPSEFGIDGGRISKLCIQRFTPTIQKVVIYERGWVIEPNKSNAKVMAAYNAILEKYN